MPGMSCAVVKRGALIVLEGCDKAGKSTHSKLLIEALKGNGKATHLINFPGKTV
jgi:dTMP kinase